MNAIVSPTEVPIWRNRVRSLVAVPSRANGTSFWTMSVKMAIVGPTPSPAISIHADSATKLVSARRFPNSQTPTPMKIRPTARRTL